MARIGITEAAQRLSLSPDTIRRRIRNGQLSAVRDNRGMWLIDLPDDATAEPCIGRNNVAPPYAAPMQPMQPMQHDSALLDMLREQLEQARSRADQAEGRAGAAEARAERAEARADRIELRTEQDRAAAVEREVWLRERLDALTTTLAARRDPWVWRDVLAWLRKRGS